MVLVSSCVCGAGDWAQGLAHNRWATPPTSWSLQHTLALNNSCGLSLQCPPRPLPRPLYWGLVLSLAFWEMAAAEVGPSRMPLGQVKACPQAHCRTLVSSSLLSHWRYVPSTLQLHRVLHPFQKIVSLFYYEDYGIGVGSYMTTFRTWVSLPTMGSGDQTQAPWAFAASPSICWAILLAWVPHFIGLP